MRIHNLRIIGTSHIAKQSIREIIAAINDEKPGIIALELDSRRLEGLLHPRKETYKLTDIRAVGITGYLFARIAAYAEEKLGESVGVKPGAEMKRAIHIAQERKIPLALIDQEIALTLRHLNARVTLREKLRFVWDLAKAFVLRKPVAGFDLSTVPSEEVIERLVGEVRVRYPNVYRTLITDRNIVMARRLAALIRHHPNVPILAIVGAGHRRDITRLIQAELAREGLKSAESGKNL
ncbi:TraB/GumN family protein [Candidatus Woesearchaeota archaeon]|nr:TraB/GumN family protein [Candidatus Woesearchaeota archaeon]